MKKATYLLMFFSTGFVTFFIKNSYFDQHPAKKMDEVMLTPIFEKNEKLSHGENLLRTGSPLEQPTHAEPTEIIGNNIHIETKISQIEEKLQKENTIERLNQGHLKTLEKVEAEETLAKLARLREEKLNSQIELIKQELAILQSNHQTRLTSYGIK